MDGLKADKRLSIIRDEGEETMAYNESLNGEGPLFHQYLERQGILDFLTNELLQLYKANLPENGLDVLKHNIAAEILDKAKLEAKKVAEEDPLFSEAMMIENEALKFRVESLEKENKLLSLEVEKSTIK